MRVLRSGGRRGFTMAEFLIVAFIITILVVAVMAWNADKMKKAAQTEAIDTIGGMRTALETYAFAHPTSTETWATVKDHSDKLGIDIPADARFDYAVTLAGNGKDCKVVAQYKGEPPGTKVVTFDTTTQPNFIPSGW